MTRGRMQLRGERETVSCVSKVKPPQSDEVMTWNLGTTLWRLFLYTGYFAMMALSVVRFSPIHTL